MSAKTDEALPRFKLITPLISADKYNSWGENRVYTLHGKLYFWNCINSYIGLKPGGRSHVSIFLLLHWETTVRENLTWSHLSLKEGIYFLHTPQKTIFGNKCRLKVSNMSSWFNNVIQGGRSIKKVELRVVPSL